MVDLEFFETAQSDYENTTRGMGRVFYGKTRGKKTKTKQLILGVINLV